MKWPRWRKVGDLYDYKRGDVLIIRDGESERRTIIIDIWQDRDHPWQYDLDLLPEPDFDDS